MNYQSEEEKGRRFLELVDKQSTLQQSIVSKLTRLINDYNWNSDGMRAEIYNQIQEHSKITREINGLEE